jgi:hypothetical protein
MQNVLCSKDFMNVSTCGSVIRPIRWVLLDKAGTRCVLITQFEADKIRSQLKDATLIMYNPKVRAGSLGPQYLNLRLPN